MSHSHDAFESFAATLEGALPSARSALYDGLIGSQTQIEGPFGPRPLIYADYVASGRALRQVETFVMEEVLPFYANTHTKASYCGARMTELREGARTKIGQLCGANKDEHAVIFSGSGATQGINQLLHLWKVGVGDTVLVGPYEHHSNLLPWRESGALVVEIPEGKEAGPDIDALRSEIKKFTQRGRVFVAMSAAANVTGVTSNVAEVTRVAKEGGAQILWDYAGGGPYLKMSMQPELDAQVDAIVFSAHKFVGGPAASGVLIVRRDSVRCDVPYRPGGGTVAFVNAHRHDYVAGLEQREEGGTPNVIGDIRAALALIVKEVIGQDYLNMRNAELTAKAFAAWSNNKHVKLLAADRPERLPILSFVPLDDTGNRIDHNAFTTALSERYGIQARGGCSCAGPYVHHLLAIADADSRRIRDNIVLGDSSEKPGFVRLNLSVLMDEETVEYILTAVAELAENWGRLDEAAA
ncbi:selenocysteine lyase/cysteine desulfurase [Shimia isoporae]|uniref:Selenocysteine lyase/cysteine desulfurase n=1 Tax=Shimia isoporae TaxID=647720 RepID=A0A4R1N8J2_9RHOB|nr:aminotransferase class V-fold PLP-dependent enzyme [Shimia isoporae]TCK98993.1 selenocysteine lyase/cysteine desulfurase [Shimia isoporae]